MTDPRVVLLSMSLAALAGCATTDRVAFVTDTEIGVGADATTQSVNVGYGRIEGVLGPAYPDTGGIPPVYGHIESDLAVFQPKVKQLYATGDAARLATAQTAEPPADAPLSGPRRMMFFGTATNVGLQLRFTGGQPSSINFGFKRKEFSVVPLQAGDPSAEKPDRYGSLIASYASQVSSGSLRESGLQVSQFIATGAAANNLAAQGATRQMFEEQAQAAMRASAAADASAFTSEIDVIVACVQRPDGTFDPAARDRLVGAAMADGSVDASQASALTAAGDAQALRAALTGTANGATKPLANVASTKGAGLCV